MNIGRVGTSPGEIPTVDILGISIHRLTRAEVLDIVEQRYRSGVPTWIVTANAELVMGAKEDGQIATVLHKADLRLADGSGIVWAARRLGDHLPARLPGVEIAEELVAWAASAGLTLYLLGSQPGVAEEATTKLQQKYRGLEVVGSRHGYFDTTQETEILAEIRDVKPDILLVALGAPRQEFWLAQHFENLGVSIAVGVGGSLDVWAGRVKRAPAWMGDRGLEWLYRLIKEPRRAKRMLALPRFVFWVLVNRVTGRSWRK
ncbi:MAG: WecB/TagA/CpsF family glycosyltransferase [Firmicutes bacterium]|nr:WecB/TagA/CpsF family glycosyltransferase [Bacillota bacterium]